jgi:hypothetical protein
MWQLLQEDLRAMTGFLNKLFSLFWEVNQQSELQGVMVDKYKVITQMATVVEAKCKG